MAEYTLDKPVSEMLAEMYKVFQTLGIDFFIVGAIARDIAIARQAENVITRKTNDIDIGVLVGSEEQFYEVKQALLNSGNFTEDTEPIRHFFKNSIQLDLLPFGGIENELREIHLTKPQLYVIDVPGFAEVFPHAEVYKLNDKLELKTCSLEGLILLKLLANDDRPERTKDLADVDTMLSFYFDLNDNEIYTNYTDVMEIFGVYEEDFQKLVSARIVGRKISRLLSDSQDLHRRLEAILERKKIGRQWSEMRAGLLENNSN